MVFVCARGASRALGRKSVTAQRAHMPASHGPRMREERESQFPDLLWNSSWAGRNLLGDVTVIWPNLGDRKHGIHCRGHIKGLRVTERARSHWLVAQMHHNRGESPPSPCEEHTCVLEGRCGQSLSRKPTNVAGTARPAQVRARWGSGSPSEVALEQGRAARKPQYPNISPGFPCRENEGEAWGPQQDSWEEAIFLPTPLRPVWPEEATMTIKLHYHVLSEKSAG